MSHVLWNLGKSSGGLPLEATAFSPTDVSVPKFGDKISFPWILILAGVHGDEAEGVWLAKAIRERWLMHFPSKKLGAVVWAKVNPDGVSKGTRWNSHDVDLNRNLPTKDWTPEVKNPRYPPGPAAASEPENKALIQILALKPTAVLSLHSFSKFQVNVNGPAMEWGKKIAGICNYPITEDIGYPTPGCLGTYAGKELGIPTITLEIERGLPQEKVLSVHVPVVESSLEYFSERV